MKKTFLIDYKGDIPTIETDDQTGLTYTSIKFNQYRQIKLTGTDKNLDEFIKEMERQSPGFKLIGVTDLSKTIAVINVFRSEPVHDSIFSIREETFNFKEDEERKIGSGTVDSIINLIDKHGTEGETIRFLTTEGEFRTFIDKEKLNDYITKNPLK